MERSALESLVNKGLSQREIGREVDLKQTAVRYWLKHHGLGTLPRSERDKVRPRKCKCGEANPAAFYGKKRTCAACHSKYTLNKGRTKRAKAVAYLGGCCKNCGFDKWQCSLDIHHLDPKQKDKNFVSMRGWSWEKVEKEIQGCVLLCKNCHAAVHAGHINIRV